MDTVLLTKDVLAEVIHSPYFWLVLLLVGPLVIRQIVISIVIGFVNKSIAATTVDRPHVLNEGKEKRVLIVGDSTAFGAGASRVDETLAGRFAHDFPNVEVINYAVNGSLTRDVVSQLKRADGKKFNLVLISTGGNDVWRFTNLRKVREYLCKAIAHAQEISDGKTILLIYNYVALGPAFPFFLRGMIRERGKIIDSMFLDVAQQFGIEAVEVFSRDRQFSLSRNSYKYFAPDGIHPNSEGYRVWYARLWSAIYLHNYGLHD
jgi:lysophospholipase L1-like esterase